MSSPPPRARLRRSGDRSGESFVGSDGYFDLTTEIYTRKIVGSVRCV